MTETFFQLVSQYGAAVMFVATFLSCLAVPIPASFVMLAGGAFVASGDIGGWQALAAPFAGAVAGDQAGYRIGRLGGGWITGRLGGHPARARLLRQARAFISRRGGYGVFLSRWLFSPLGPYVNFLGGAARLDARVFLVWDVAGEAVWVGAYVGLGFAFSDRISEIADLLGNSVALAAAGVVTALLGSLLLRAARRRPPRRA